MSRSSKNLNPFKDTKEEKEVAKLMDQLSWKKKEAHLAKSNYLRAAYEVTRIEIALDLAVKIAIEKRNGRKK